MEEEVHRSKTANEEIWDRGFREEYMRGRQQLSDL